MLDKLTVLKKWRQPHIMPIIYTASLSLGVFFTLVFSLRLRSESGNSVLFGYSIERLILGGGLLVIFILLTILSVSFIRRPDISKRTWESIFLNQASNSGVFLLASFVFLLVWIILLLPAYRLGGLAGYVTQLRPVITWLAFAGGLAVIFILFENGSARRGGALFGNKVSIFVWIVGFCLFAIATGIPFVFGLGLQNPEDYWYPTGVPILGLQVIFSMLAGVWMMWFERNRKNRLKNRFDILICSILWATAAALWVMEPIHPNYFMPDTAGNPMFPYSDSATYDIGSQFALIGQGLFGGRYFDRALYIAFLTYLHMLFGQDYEALLSAQAIIFAIFPVIIYMIGRELYGRALGISAGILISLRGLNSLASATWLDTAGPKMILTDFVAAIGVAAIILFVLRWMKNPHKGTNAVWAGASLGLTIMLRTNVVALIPVVLVYFWLIWRRARKLMIVSIFLFVIGMVSFTTPWDVRNRKNGIPMFYVYYSRIETVLRSRYGVGSTMNPAPSPIIASDIAGNSPRNSRQRIVEFDDSPYCQSGICKVSNHFFHNYITSLLSLPSSFVLDDLWNTVKLSAPYWLNSWRGEGVGFISALFILVNLAMISLGVSAAWVRNKVASFVPLIVFGAYIASNSLALTSGGRYIVPADWIILLYFMLGILVVADWILRYGGFISEDSQAELMNETEIPVRLFAGQTKGIVGAFFLIVFMGSLVPFSEIPFQRRYQDESISDTLDRLEQTGLLEETPFSREEFDLFFTQPDAVLRVGRLLYPRYYIAGEGEADLHYPYVKLEYPRLVFQVLGPFFGGWEYVIIAGERSRYDMHALDVVVIGCRSSLNIDRSRHINGVLVFVLSNPGDVYLRAPLSELKCPLATPDVAR